VKLILSLSLDETRFIQGIIDRYERCKGVKLKQSQVVHWLMQNGFQGVINEMRHLEVNTLPPVDPVIPFPPKSRKTTVQTGRSNPKLTIIEGGKGA